MGLLGGSWASGEQPSTPVRKLPDWVSLQSLTPVKVHYLVILLLPCAFFKKKKFIYDCAGSSLLHRLYSSCSKQGLLSSCSTWASHCGGFSSCGAWAPGCKDSAAALHSLVAPWHVASSSTRDRPHVPCTSRWVLKHRVTREIQGEELLSYISNNTGRTPEFFNSILNF